MQEDARIWDDDGPDGETTSIVMSYGRNHDWYLTIEGENWGGDRVVSPGFRACTSGPKCSIVTSIVALLAAVGRGDREHAIRISEGITEDLKRAWSRLPEPDHDRRSV